ncbi:MAG: RagB/SusD family nutrient uptake outer membrane protein [Mangrovibacterium sp.]
MKNILYILIASWGLSSCSGFLEEYSQDSVSVETVEHFHALILNEFSDEYALLASINHMSDNMSEVPTTEQSSKAGYKPTYTWQQEIEYDEDGNRLSSINTAWAACYNDINIMNYVFESIDDLSGTTAEKSFLMGEAYFVRAMQYFNLLNLYGKPFNAATKDTDLGVIIKDGIDVQQAYDRSSVAECYAHIEADLLNAIDYITKSEISKAKTHPSINACNLLMARVKLFQEEWTEAAEYASKVITVGKLQSIAAGATNFINESNVELIYVWQKKASNLVTWGKGTSITWDYVASESLVNAYETGDNRKGLYIASFNYAGNNYYANRKAIGGTEGTESAYTTYFYQNLRTSEAYLIKAEALARQGDVSGATTLVKALHAKRFSDASALIYPTDAAKMVDYIFDERRREFCFEDSHRWFDLRRMPNQPTIVHGYTSLETNGSVLSYEIFKLFPGDLNYTLPLPLLERENNPNVMNNEREDKISMN